MKNFLGNLAYAAPAIPVVFVLNLYTKDFIAAMALTAGAAVIIGMFIVIGNQIKKG